MVALYIWVFVYYKTAPWGSAIIHRNWQGTGGETSHLGIHVLYFLYEIFLFRKVNQVKRKVKTFLVEIDLLQYNMIHTKMNFEEFIIMYGYFHDVIFSCFPNPEK